MQVLGLIHHVADVDIGQNASQVGQDPAVDAQVVERALYAAFEIQALPGSELLQVQVGFGGPGVHEARQDVQVKVNFPDVDVVGAAALQFHVPDGSTHVHPDSVVRVHRRDVVQVDVVHGAAHVTAGYAAERGLQAGEMGHGIAQVHQRAIPDNPVNDHLVGEIIVLVQRTFQPQVLQIDIGIAVVDVEVPDVHQLLAHAQALGVYLVEVHSGGPFQELEGGLLAGDMVFGHLEVLYVGPFQQHAQVVPVNDAFRNRFAASA